MARSHNDAPDWQCVRQQLGLPPQVPGTVLANAFRHPSYVREARMPPETSNQRLEFLGDAVLGLVLAQYFYESFPEAPEGELTKKKAAAVRQKPLAQIAERLQLGEYVLLGRGEEQSGGRNRPSLLADCLEAVIGAIYIAAGYEPARAYVLDIFDEYLADIDRSHAAYDFKTALQELVQKHTQQTPEYRTVKTSGPPHNRTFSVEARVADRIVGHGTGPSKQKAQQAAAEEALDNTSSWLQSTLQTHDDDDG